MHSLRIVILLILLLCRSIEPLHATELDRPYLVDQGSHTDSVTTLAFSADDEILASGSEDGAVKVWNLHDKSLICSLLGHKGSVRKVTFSRDQKCLASIDSQGVIVVWALQTKTVHRRFEINKRGYTAQLKFCNDNCLFVALSGEYRLWDINNSTLKFSHHEEGIMCDISDSGRFLAIANSEGRLKILSIPALSQRAVGNFQDIRALRFEPNETVLLAGSGRWNWKTNTVSDSKQEFDNSVFVGRKGDDLDETEKHSIFGSEMSTTAFSNNGRYVVSIRSYGGVGIWDMASKTLANYIDFDDLDSGSKNLPAWYSANAVDNSGNFVAMGQGRNVIEQEDPMGGYKVILWSTKTDQKVFLGSLGQLIQDVSFSLDGSSIAITTADRTCSIFDLKNWPSLKQVRDGESPKEMSWILRGQLFGDSQLLTTSVRGMIQVWDARTGKYLSELLPEPELVSEWNQSFGMRRERFGTAMPSKGVGVVQLAKSFDAEHGTLVTLCSDQNVRVWDVSNRVMLGKVRLVDRDTVYDFVCYDGSNRVITRRYGDTIEVHDILTDKLISTVKCEARRVVQGEYGSSRLILGGNQVKIVDASSGEVIRVFSSGGDPLCKSADEQSVAVFDNGYYILDLKSGERKKLSIGLSGLNSFNCVFAKIHKTSVLALWNNSRVTFWDLQNDSEIASLSLLNAKDWIVLAPDARFDANNLDDINTVKWNVPDLPLETVPVESFMQQYFEPNLLARLIDRESMAKVPSISSLNRVQPEVSIQKDGIHLEDGVEDAVDVTVSFKSITSAKNGKESLRSGVYDLRLFRDGQLVGHLPVDRAFTAASDDLSNGSDEQNTHIFKGIRLPHNGSNKFEFTAYAFNVDSVKSVTAKQSLELPKPLPIRKGRAYIVGFGVNQYSQDHSIRRLDCAVADALAYGETLRRTLENSKKFSQVTFIPLVSDSADSIPLQLSQYRPATKKSLKTVLDVLTNRAPDDQETAAFLQRLDVKESEPDDLIFFAFSCHGETCRAGELNGGNGKQEFYILPEETVLDRTSLDRLSVSLEGTAISSMNLTDWLVDVQASEMIMVIDSCYSGSAVSQEFKPAPMNSRGLGQLAYYKGMRLLSASQADSTAAEYKTLGHGLLTHCLLTEGIQQLLADVNPRDGTLTATEWLHYAVIKVPEVDASSDKNGFRALDEKTANINLNRGVKSVTTFNEVTGDTVETKVLQVPHLFDFAKGSDFELINEKK